MSEGSKSGEFPKFLIGTAISTYQNGGAAGASNWDYYQKQKVWLGLRPTIMNGDHIGSSTGLWERYEDDLKLARDIGSNAFRFSFEWALIEPERGRIDEHAIRRFHGLIDCIRRNGMEPMATLHHFVHPQWFEELGGFKEEGNVPLFLDFCQLAFKHFGPKVTSWCTFNEPGVFCFSGYCAAGFPPGRLLAFGAAGRVLRNMLAAHTRAYNLIKAMPGGGAARVGIVHNLMPYEAKPTRWGRWIWWPRALAALASHCWGNTVILNYLRTGVLNWQPLGPLWGYVRHRDLGGRPPLDWIGLNYYSRVMLDWRLSPVVHPWETANDMFTSIYPAGLYEAIRQVSVLERPIYITETGIADARDTLRAQWAQEYFRAVEHAVADGYDVRGLLYWTLVDNFEWAFGWAPRFGLFAWEHTDPQNRRVERQSTGSTIRGLFTSLPMKVEALWKEGRTSIPQRHEQLEAAHS